MALFDIGNFEAILSLLYLYQLDETANTQSLKI